jgi:hypothetical protein
MMDAITELKNNQGIGKDTEGSNTSLDNSTLR